MKKIFKDALKIGSGIIIGMSMTAFATTLLTDVYLNEEIKISVNGQVADLRDATTNEKEYPLTYKNRTYIPLRSVATLLGFDVGYVQETNTATVDNKPQETQPEPEKEEPKRDNTKITLNNLTTNDIPLINQYTWVDTPKNANDAWGARVQNAVRSIYSISKNWDYDDEYIHPQSPFKEELNKIRKEILDHSSYDEGELYISVDCIKDSIKFLKFAYDSSNKLKGFVASYTLKVTYLQNGKKEITDQEITSVFIDDGDNHYDWVCDIVD